MGDTAANELRPLGATMEQWANGRRRRDEIRAKTHQAHMTHIRSLTGHLGADISVSDVTEDHVTGWLDALATRGVGPRSRNIYLSTARSFFAFAAAPSRRWVDVDPTGEIRSARVPRRQPRRVQAGLVSSILTTADFRVRVMIILAVCLGLRRGELAAMRVEDWDREARTLLVHGKGDKERVLPVDGEAEAALAAWLTDGRTSGWMWPSQKGGGLSGNRIGCIISEAAQRHQARATPHQYRHTFGGEMAAAGVPIEVIRQLLGHESVATTGIYIEATAAEVRRATDAVECRTYFQGWPGPGDGRAEGPAA